MELFSVSERARNWTAPFRERSMSSQDGPLSNEQRLGLNPPPLGDAKAVTLANGVTFPAAEAFRARI